MIEQPTRTHHYISNLQEHDPRPVLSMYYGDWPSRVTMHTKRLGKRGIGDDLALLAFAARCGNLDACGGWIGDCYGRPELPMDREPTVQELNEQLLHDVTCPDGDACKRRREP